MAKKVCTNCGEEKDETEYSWRWKALGKRQSICKDCQREKSAQWYQEHREEHIERTRRSKAEAIEKAREFIWDYLSHSICADCGEYLPDVLTFDHVRGEKNLRYPRWYLKAIALKQFKMKYQNVKWSAPTAI